MNLIFRDIDDIANLHIEGVLFISQSISHTWATTDFVIDAYGDDSSHVIHELINIALISLITFSDSEVVEIQKIYLKHKNSLSMADCSVLFYANTTNSVLVSDQKILIDIGASYKIKTYTMSTYFQEVKLYKTG
jgi:predicted nucleic acid-binding protein